MKISYKFRSAAILLLTIFFVGWGATGHKLVNQNTTLSFPPQMNEFMYWSTILAQHASDADYRKDSDQTEYPKHFIDIDSYPEFNSTGRISQSNDSVVALHGLSFVTDEGILPWATIAAYDTLKNCFIRRDWNKAVLIAADLGHYVADAHQPLHITKNYNPGGLHSRYETTMINTYQNQIQIKGDSVQYISNISDFVFGYIYKNYIYVDSVIDDDAAARAFNSDTKSSAYYQKLWELTGGFTIKLLNQASWNLANIIYTAWIDAGSPLPSTTDISNVKNNISSFELYQNYPNPFNPSTTIKYQIPKSGFVQLKVYNILGREAATIVNEFQTAGEHSVQFSSDNTQQTINHKQLSSGVYFYQLKSGSHVESRKLLLLK